MWPDGKRFTSVSSPRTRTRPKVVSRVRFTAPEISETLYSGKFETEEGRGSSIAVAYASARRHGTPKRDNDAGSGMNVLVVGSGGREPALCWAIANSPLLTKLYCAPGNPGIAAVAECINIDSLDIPALVGFAQDHAIDLVVPGPEAPLVAGLTDAMEDAGIPCCGPTKAAAQLEGSKTFTKELADAASIPTAMWERFDDIEQARAFVRKRGVPIVVKADGLAGGKGVTVATSEDEALTAIDTIMDRKAFGEAAIVIEECLAGEEVSLFALCDG